jgi:hypothetical protein
MWADMGDLGAGRTDETIGPFRFILVTTETDQEAVERMRHAMYCRGRGREEPELSKPWARLPPRPGAGVETGH